MNIPWKTTAAIVATVTGLGYAANTVRPILQSDPPPWASIQTVGEAAQMVRESIQDLKVDMLSARLFNYRREQCTAIRRGDMRLAATIGAQIQRSNDEYYNLTMRFFEIRPCDEF